MAYQYDEMGNVVGEYESEEERRLREAASQPVKQTITYNPDGTSEVTIKGTPEALSPINPNSPTLTMPGQATDNTYQRMLQVESGNRDFTKTGQPVTSPKGAMFASQVMPATAANPGYGVRPAQSQTPEEYNRVGREYYQALLKQFGGDEQKAAAAYNAGPGRVQQNIQRNQGMMNVSQLPQETQGYLQKVGFNPQAQAVSPQQMAQQPQPSPYSLSTGQTGLGMQAPVAQPAPQPSANPVIDFYQKFQDDPRALISMAYTSENVGVPDWMRDRMKNRASELITQQRELETAKQQIPTMTENEIARTLREKTTGGSYLKAALFGVLGMEQSAMAEAAKLGIGKEQTVMLADGSPALIKVASNGTPIEGYNATTGKKLSASELISAQAGGGVLGKGASLSADVYVDQTTGQRYRSGYDNAGKAAMVNIQGGAPYRGDPKNLALQSIGTAQARADIGLITELKKKHGTNVLDAEKDYVSLNGPFKSQDDRAQFRQAYGFDLAQPAGTGTQPGAQAGQPAGGAGAGGNVNVPLAQQQRQAQAQKDIVTDAAKEVAKSADTQNLLNSINKVTGLIDSGEHNIGSLLSGVVGRGRIAQAIGGQLETTDAKNTNTIMETVQKLATDGLKALGSNPSTADLEFYTKYKPDATSDPAFVKEWIESRSADLKRRLGYATTQVGAGGGAGSAPAVPSASQFKIISVEPGKK